MSPILLWLQVSRSRRDLPFGRVVCTSDLQAFDQHGFTAAAHGAPAPWAAVFPDGDFSVPYLLARVDNKQWLCDPEPSFAPPFSRCENLRRHHAEVAQDPRRR